MRKTTGAFAAFDRKFLHNWKRFKQKWSNYELATGVTDKDDAIVQIAIFLTVIADEALDVYNTFTWDSEEDKVKIDKVLEQFEKF